MHGIASESGPSPDLHAHLRRLDRRVRWLGAACLLLLCALLVLLLGAARAPAQKTLDVERINIVEPDGSVRLVISNASQFPLPRIGGKEFKRQVTPAGLVFYDSRGNEVGGIALTDVEAGKVSALAFDYPNYDAIGLITRTNADNSKATAGLLINSHPPADMDIHQAGKVVQHRIAVLNEEEDAKIVLSDPQGRERIRMHVDRDGEPRFEILDADGKVTFAAPQSDAH